MKIVNKQLMKSKQACDNKSKQTTTEKVNKQLMTKSKQTAYEKSK